MRWPRGEVPRPQVLSVDPAIGTGTSRHIILEPATGLSRGPTGRAPMTGMLSKTATRLIGFELQMAPRRRLSC
jgi:hypothetical protein